MYFWHVREGDNAGWYFGGTPDQNGSIGPFDSFAEALKASTEKSAAPKKPEGSGK